MRPRHLVWLAIPFGLTILCPVAIHAEPGDGIDIAGIRLSPTVGVSVTYDSNVDLDNQNTVEDTFLEFNGGLDFACQRDALSLAGRLIGLSRSYSKSGDHSHDFVNMSERVNLTAGSRDTLLVGVNQGAGKIDDYDRWTYTTAEGINQENQNLALSLDRNERVRRIVNDLGVTVGRNVTDKIGVEVGYNYDAARYRDSGLFDSTDQRGQVEGAIRLTDKTDAIATFQYGVQQSDAYTHDAHSIIARAGLKTRSTDKVGFRGEAGMQVYQRDMNDPTAPMEDDRIFSFDLAAYWLATDRLAFQWTGRDDIQPASVYQDVAREVTLTSLSAVYKLKPSVALSLTGSYRTDDYRFSSTPRGDNGQRKDVLKGYLARIDYTPHARWMSAYGELSYETVDSIQRDYDQLRVGGGLTLRY